METNEILKQLRESRGLTMKEVSQSTQMATSLISDYETGKKALGMKVAIRFADFYNVSLDYLVGREPAPNPIADLSVRVDDKKFIELYSALPEYAKQIFVDTMSKLAQAAEQANQKQRHVERLGDIEDRMEQERQAKAKDVI
ncbi:MAG: helix-turn-helix transcriptional regulator [Ruminococcus sp.]|nr:helix-turn-helix transcriptional regulator [Ruminococcus sp.]